MIDYSNKINIDYNYGEKLKENEIAFVIYCNASDTDITDFCNNIYYILSLGHWILKNKDITMYIVDSNFDILGLENKNAYNKVIYIKCEEISNEKINVNNFRKMNDIYQKDTILSNCTIYSCYERKLDKLIKLSPYGYGCFYDIDKLVDENIFIKIEEIFAKENYRKKMLTLYGKRNFTGNGKLLSSDSGFEFCSIRNDIAINKDIISIINNKLKTNLNKLVFDNYKIENHMEAFIEIFKVIYDNKLDDESINTLEKYISEIENKLGNYIKLYSIKEEGNDTNESNLVNPFFINCGTWCLIYQNAILIISYGLDE